MALPPYEPDGSLPAVPADDVTLADLVDRYGVSKQTLYTRLGAIGVTGTKRGKTSVFSPVDVHQMDAAHFWIGKGYGLKDLQAAVTGDNEHQEHEAEVTAATTAAVPEAAITPSMVALVQALQQLQQPPAPTPPTDPLRRAKGLADAADGVLVLTTDDLKELGVAGVDGFKDGDVAYGYSFHKHNQRNRTLWTVKRTIGANADGVVPALKALPDANERRVGFRAELMAQTINVEAITLPRF